MKKIKLEIIDDNSDVIRSYMLNYDETEGKRMRLIINDNVYHFDTDGDFAYLTEEEFDAEPVLRNLDKEWATEFKKRVIEDNTIVNLGEGLDLKHVYAFNKETGETQKLFDEETLVPIPKKKL